MSNKFGGAEVNWIRDFNDLCNDFESFILTN